jgi:hypothetical protein
MVSSAIIKSQARKILGDSQIKATKHFLYSNLYGDSLPKLAIAFETDKEGARFYAKHYQHHFQALRHNNLNLLEIGIGGYDNPKTGGGILKDVESLF